MKVTHVLFDMDGLLLDTESIYTIVGQKILGEYGLEYSMTLKAQMMGKKEHDAAQHLVQQTGIPMTPQEYLDRRNKEQNLLFPHCKALPGVHELVSHLKKHNIPMAVATSSHKEAFDIKTSNHSGLFTQFDGVLCGDEVKNGKPHPEIFLEASKLIGHPEPKNCLVFEDSISGVKAGLNAGMNVIYIPSTPIEMPEELKSRCAEVLKSMADFDPVKYGLPPFE